MAIQTQVWARDIAKKLFPANSFMVEAVNDDSLVSNKTVNLVESGGIPEVEVDPTVFPMTPSQRVDTPLDYNIREFVTKPTVIRDIEEVETNYGKRMTVLDQHVMSLNTKIANYLAYVWSATLAANIIRTTGANRAAMVTGATGLRKKITIENFMVANELFDDMDLGEDEGNATGGRVCLMPSFMYNDLVKDNWKELLALDKTGDAKIFNGKQLIELFGIKIYKRGKKNIPSYTNAGTPVPRPVTASALTSANAATLFWHPNFVRRALGQVKVFAKIDDPEWQGSTFSANARAGGYKRYSDETGMIALVEDVGA